SLLAHLGMHRADVDTARVTRWRGRRVLRVACRIGAELFGAPGRAEVAQRPRVTHRGGGARRVDAHATHRIASRFGGRHPLVPTPRADAVLPDGPHAHSPASPSMARHPAG